ncbi:hypothetical protein ABPG72_005986 [Tetrahymena utriculariae]
MYLSQSNLWPQLILPTQIVSLQQKLLRAFQNRISRHQQDYIYHNREISQIALQAGCSISDVKKILSKSLIKDQQFKKDIQSKFVVSLTSLVTMLCYILINFPSDYVLSQKDLKIGVFIGIFFTILGSWIRLLININFQWAIIGQVFGGIAQPFVQNAPTQIAAAWFKPYQRQMATSILYLVGVIRVGIGFLFSSFVVSSSYSDDTKQEIYNLMLFQAITVTACCIPTLFFQGKPPSPPRNNYIKKNETNYFGAIFIVSGIIFSGIITTLKFFFGFFATPLIPLTLEFLCEITFPISESISSVILNVIKKIILSTEDIKIGSQQSVYVCLGIGLFLQVIGLAFIIPVKENLKRKNQEKLQLQKPAEQILELSEVIYSQLINTNAMSFFKQKNRFVTNRQN